MFLIEFRALQHEVHGESEEMQQEATRIKRRVLGVVKLIGELFHRKLLGFKIVNDVVVELVMRSEEPDEYLVECFLQLISTVGKTCCYSSFLFIFSLMNTFAFCFVGLFCLVLSSSSLINTFAFFFVVECILQLNGW